MPGIPFHAGSCQRNNPHNRANVVVKPGQPRTAKRALWFPRLQAYQGLSARTVENLPPRQIAYKEKGGRGG
jgi:hypothetical protein